MILWNLCSRVKRLREVTSCQERAKNKRTHHARPAFACGAKGRSPCFDCVRAIEPFSVARVKVAAAKVARLIAAPPIDSCGRAMRFLRFVASSHSTATPRAGIPIPAINRWLAGRSLVEQRCHFVWHCATRSYLWLSTAFVSLACNRVTGLLKDEKQVYPPTIDFHRNLCRN